MDSHELQKQTILQSISASEIKSHSYTKIPPTLNIFPSLSLHISGRKRITSGRKISSRVMCALVSDKLAGNPLQSFLCRRGQDKEKKLFEMIQKISNNIMFPFPFYPFLFVYWFCFLICCFLNCR